MQLYLNTLLSTAPYYSAMHYTAFVTKHSSTFITLQNMTLYRIASHYITVRRIRLHHIPSHRLTLIVITIDYSAMPSHIIHGTA